MLNSDHYSVLSMNKGIFQTSTGYLVTGLGFQGSVRNVSFALMVRADEMERDWFSSFFKDVHEVFTEMFS